MLNPPLLAPTSLKDRALSQLPGQVNYVDIREGMQGVRPVHDNQFDIQASELKCQQHRQRISRAFYEDLFLMLAQMERPNMTAYEVEERTREKLLALGPVVENLQGDLLAPIIDNSFDIMAQLGEIPPPPPELQGVDLKVEFISIISQIQKQQGIASTDRFIGFTGAMAKISPEALDKVNFDELTASYGDDIGISKKVIRTDDEVAMIRGQRNQAAAQQQRVATIEQASKAAKNLSQSDTEGDNALTRLLGK
jgi:hypothetical protein